MRLTDAMKEKIRRDYSATDNDGRPLLKVEQVAEKNKVNQSTVQALVVDLPPRKLRATGAKPKDLLAWAMTTKAGMGKKKQTANQKKISAANQKLAPGVTLNALIKDFIAKVRMAAPEISVVEIKLHKTESFRIEVK